MSKGPHSWRADDPFYECEFHWHTADANGPHICRKPFGHIHDITNDDHRCCCGATHDEMKGQA